MREISIIQLENEDAISKALTLGWDVFMKYEAPDYTQEGVDEFRESIQDPEFLKMITLYAAFQGEQMLGVIATRNRGSHIALFFVDGNYHKQGIGRKLFEAALKQNTSQFMTVNSSLFAVPVYRKLGFRETDVERVTNGIRFTPMKMEISQTDNNLPGFRKKIEKEVI